MKAVRLIIRQSSANYRREETINNKMTYPLPPYSTVIGAIHKACGYREYHPMDISIQGDYMSARRQLYRQYYSLNNCCDDRGTLELHPSEDIITNSSIKIAKAVARNASFRKNKNIIIYNPKEYDTFLSVVENKKLAADEKKKIREEKKEYEKSRRENNIKKKEYKEYPDYIRILEKEQEINAKVDEMTRRYNMYHAVEYIPAYYEVLYGVSLILHIRTDEDTLNDILNNINNIQSLGRSEDFIEMEEATLVELEEADEGCTNSLPAYIPAKLFDEEVIQMTMKDGIPAGGTRFFLPKKYELENGIRKFDRKAVIYTSQFEVYDQSYSDEKVYKDVQSSQEYLVCFV